MLSKCANPGCLAPFLYLHEGKIFYLETEAPGAESNMPGERPRNVERFWLCGTCSRTMTLTYARGHVSTVPLRISVPASKPQAEPAITA